MNKIIKETNETCYECGRSVAWGSGRFVNRIPSGDSYKLRKDMGVLYPNGDWLCAECEEAGDRGDEEYFNQFIPKEAR